jgi:hypothetical protein
MKGITSSVRRPARWAILPAIAMIGVLAGLTNAFAFDQQATGPEMDNALNWQAARGSSISGAHAQAPFRKGRDSGAPSIKADDQQATGAEMDDATNWGMVTGAGGGR